MNNQGISLNVEYNKFVMFTGEKRVFVAKLRPSLYSDDLEFISSDENIVKVGQKFGATVMLEGGNLGNAELTVRLKSRPEISVKTKIIIVGAVKEPQIIGTEYNDKDVTIRINKFGASEVLVDTSWQTDAIDEVVTTDVIKVKLPKYNTRYSIAIASRIDGKTSRWITCNLESVKEDIQLSSNSLKVTEEGRENGQIYLSINIDSDITKLVINRDWAKDSDKLELDVRDLEGYSETSNRLYLSYYLDVPNYISYFSVTGYAGDKSITSEKIRTYTKTVKIPDDTYTYQDSKGTPYVYEHNFDFLGFKFVNLYTTPNSSTSPARVLDGSHVIYCTELEEGESYGYLPPLKVFDDEGDSSPDGEGAFCEILLCEDGTLRKYYMHGDKGLGELFPLADLPMKATVGLQDRHNNGIIPNIDSTMINGNRAIAFLPIKDSIAIALGFRLLKETTIYTLEGKEIRKLPKGAWIWGLENKYYWPKTLKPFQRSMKIPDRICINSYSIGVSVDEILNNLRVLKEGEYKGKYEGYWMDTGFITGKKENFVIDTSKVRNSRNNKYPTARFPMSNEGDYAMVWNGGEYSVRSNTENLANDPDNVIGKLQQGYIVHTEGGRDEMFLTKHNCQWTAGPDQVLGNNFFGGLSDRHKVQEFYSVKGMFANQKLTSGHCMCRNYIAMASKLFRHPQGQEHVSMDERASHQIERYETNVLESFFPFVEYIARRIRKKCVEATGETLDLLQPVLSCFNSNFAVYNEPNVFYTCLGFQDNSPMYGARVMKNNVRLYSYGTSNGLSPLRNNNFDYIVLNEGDWVWFSEKFPAKICKYNEDCISILGFSKGSDNYGNPNVPEVVHCYVDVGLSNLTPDKTTLSDKVNNILNGGTEARVRSDSARNYNIATMANKSGDEPTLLYEDDLYNRFTKNTLCYNTTSRITLTDEDGNLDYIPYGALFTLIGEYEHSNKKTTRIYYFSQDKGHYCFGNLNVPAASLFKYDVRNLATLTQKINGKEYGCLTLIADKSKIYTKWGEYFANAVENDFILFDKDIVIPKKKVDMSFSTLPEYLKNGFKPIYEDDYEEFQNHNKSTTEPVAPNWFDISYYGYRDNSGEIEIVEVDGYVSLDFSKIYRLDYTTNTHVPDPPFGQIID